MTLAGAGPDRNAIAVDSLEDARIAPFRNVRDRDLRREAEGLFVVEGEVPLRVLLGQPHRRARGLLLSAAQAERLAPLLATRSPGIPLYVAPQPLLEAIVGFPLHRGVLALAERGAAARHDALLAHARLVVAICGVTNHDNVGGLFRNAAAFGADAVLLDGASCDPLYRKAVRVSVGASIVVPYARLADEAQLVDALGAAGHTVLALSPRGELAIGRDPPPPGPVAVLCGAEGPGLAAATLRRCTTARIPMRPGWDSLNVAVAGGIALAWLATVSRG